VIQLKKEPLKRALRCDKVTLATALEAVLKPTPNLKTLAQRPCQALKLGLADRQANTRAKADTSPVTGLSWPGAAMPFQVTAVEVMGQDGTAPPIDVHPVTHAPAPHIPCEE